MGSVIFRFMAVPFDALIASNFECVLEGELEQNSLLLCSAKYLHMCRSSALGVS